MDYDDNNDDEDDFMKFVLDIFPLNIFLNVNGFSVSAVAIYCMKVVASWPIVHCATCYMEGFRFSRLLSLRRRPSLQFYSVQCSLPYVSEKRTASIFRISEFV
jgi:hypothetical protein